MTPILAEKSDGCTSGFFHVRSAAVEFPIISISEERKIEDWQRNHLFAIIQKSIASGMSDISRRMRTMNDEAASWALKRRNGLEMLEE